MRQWRWWESLGGNIQIPVGRVEVGGKEGGWQANRSPVVTPAAAAAAAIHTICPHYPHSANLTCIAPSACWALHAWKHTNIQTAGLMWHLRCPHCRPCIPFLFSLFLLALFDISISDIDCRYIDTYIKYRYRYRYRQGDFGKYRYR